MSLCLYNPEQEENIFIRKRAKTWQRSGFLSEDQLRMIQERTDPQLIESSPFFRILYFVFTCICFVAAIGLFTWILDTHGEQTYGLIFLICCIPIYCLAEYAVQRYRLYRYGIEEALAMLSLGLFWLGIVLMFPNMPWRHGFNPIIATDAMLACLVSYWMYCRFGFLYAALISIVALCIVPFQLSLPYYWERILLVLTLGVLFLISLQTESDGLEDFRKKRKGLIQASLFAGIYLSVNLRIFEVSKSWSDQTPSHLTPYAGFPPTIYWATYILTFLIPVMGLYLGIKNRKRGLMSAAGIALILSFATNKDYLELKHYAWDPIIFGATLILTAVLIIRWLSKGPNGERCGFTSESILKPEQCGLSPADIVAAAIPSITIAPREAQSTGPSPFEDGQSGGGGASRDF